METGSNNSTRGGGWQAAPPGGLLASPPVAAGAARPREETGDTVLVVNDVYDQVELLRHLLRKSGYGVLSAYDGREGYEVALAARPALIISDVTMPRMDGIELCRAVRAHPELHTTPLLLVSGVRRDSESVLAGFEAGADDYLELPYDPMRLVAKVAHLLERSRAEAALRRGAEEL